MRVLTLNIRYGAGEEALDQSGWDVPVRADKLSAVNAERPRGAFLIQHSSVKMVSTGT